MNKKPAVIRKLWIFLLGKKSAGFCFHKNAFFFLTDSIFRRYRLFFLRSGAVFHTGIFTRARSYPHSPFLPDSAILESERRCRMNQQELQETIIKKQEQRIREMEQVMELLEKENSAQRELIRCLKRENELLQNYTDAVRDIMSTFPEPEGEET